MNTPQTWTKDEITELIATEIRETRADFLARLKVGPTAAQIADAIYTALNDKGLLEDTP